MAKQTHHLVLIIFLILLLPDTVYAARPIQTAQRIIILDPGHGGTENGITSSTGLKEKDITLRLAQKTAHILEDRFNVFLTRTQDTYVSSQARVSMANQKKANLFLSLHIGHSTEPRAFFYYFDLPQPTKADKSHYSKWTTAPLKYQSKSKHMADIFSKTFHAHTSTVKNTIKPMPVIPLEGTTMPALLIEPLSMNQILRPADSLERILDQYARLIAISIDRCFEKQ